MAVIISDTGPVNYLVLLGRIEILGAMFERVILPEAVRAELLHSKAPFEVQEWAKQPPGWLEVRKGVDVLSLPSGFAQKVEDLGSGETEAIALGYELGLAVIMDDQEARLAAESCGVSIVGTLGILAEAHNRSLLDYREVTRELRSYGFHGSQQVIDLVFRTICGA